MEKEKRTITAKRQQRGLTVTHVRTLEFSPEDIVRKTSELTNQITQLEFHIGRLSDELNWAKEELLLLQKGDI